MSGGGLTGGGMVKLRLIKNWNNLVAGECIEVDQKTAERLLRELGAEPANASERASFDKRGERRDV